MKLELLRQVLIAVVALLPSLPAKGARLSLASWDGGGAGPVASALYTEAVNNVGSLQTSQPSGLPFVTADRATSGVNASETAYDFSVSGFSIDIVEHYRIDDSDVYSFGAVYFTIDSDAGYLLGGSYAMSGFSDVFYSATLLDLTAQELRFESVQVSRSTEDASFVLGGSAGDQENSLSGSLAGYLSAGHIYRLLYNASLRSEGRPLESSAVGSFRLTVVPEPCTSPLELIGVSVVILLRAVRGANGNGASPSGVSRQA